MTFPSDYKRVQQPGGTAGVVNAEIGLARQLLVDTTNWNLRLMDGGTPGGFEISMVKDLPDLLQLNSDLPDVLGIIGQISKTQVEIGTDPDARLITPIVLKSIFDKFVDTSTAGSWKIKPTGMPDAFKGVAEQITDADDAVLNGFYVADPSICLNLPDAVPDNNNLNVAINVIAQSIDNLIQILYIRDDSTRIWTRVKKDTVWHAWLLATSVTAADILLKLSRDGSLPMTGNLNMDIHGINNLTQINLGRIGRTDHCINGCFDVWQRGPGPQTINGYQAADRWRSDSVGSTKSITQQSHTIGQTLVPGNDTFFQRSVITSVTGANNFASNSQRVEDVRRLAGKKVTWLFAAKADSAKDIAISINQNFGTGGSPSAEVTAIGAQRKTLAVGFQLYSAVIDIPPINGKTLGSDNNSYTEFKFWYDAGSSFNAQTASLGQQSGTFDISHVGFIEGDVSKEIDPIPKLKLSEITSQCERYYEISARYNEQSYMTLSQNIVMSRPWRTRKRAAPSVGFTLNSGVNANPNSVGGSTLVMTTLFVKDGTSGAYNIVFEASADAEL
jgi:hypothetical protein